MPDYIVFAPFDDCYANGLKAADLYDHYPMCDVSLTYKGEENLVGWYIYDAEANLIAVLEADELFLPTAYGRYYAKPVFDNSNI